MCGAGRWSTYSQLPSGVRRLKSGRIEMWSLGNGLFQKWKAWLVGFGGAREQPVRGVPEQNGGHLDESLEGLRTVLKFG